MAHNYDLDCNDYEQIDNHWNEETADKYAVDFNGVWYKNE